MRDAPERLYILWDDGMVEDWAEVVCEGADHVEYIRSDIRDAEVERLREERDTARRALDTIAHHIAPMLATGDYRQGWLDGTQTLRDIARAMLAVGVGSE